MWMLCVRKDLLSPTLLHGWVRSEGRKLSDVGVGISFGFESVQRSSKLHYHFDKKFVLWNIYVPFPARPRDFSLVQHVQAGSEAYSASYSISSRCSFLGSKAAGAWKWPLPTTCLHSVHRNSFSLLTYLLTYVLTRWSTVLLEKLNDSQLVKKFPAFYGTRRFITAFTSARHPSISWDRPVQSMPPNPLPEDPS